jgi:hypothetical protein
MFIIYLSILYSMTMTINYMRQPPQGLTQPHIETLGSYTTYTVTVCIGLRKGYGARVGALYLMYSEKHQPLTTGGNPGAKSHIPEVYVYTTYIGSTYGAPRLPGLVRFSLWNWSRF